MIPSSLAAGVVAFRAAIVAAKPIAGLTSLQLSALVSYGNELVAVTDDALAARGTPLEAADPMGHPTALIADVRARLAAATDQAALSDLRGVLGRGVLNLAQGAA